MGKFYPQVYFWALCILTASLLSGCSGAQVQLPALGAQASILAFGDSLTHGTGATPAQSYPAILQDLIHRKVINAGVPGETTAEGLQRLPGVLDNTQPDLVILCLGGNDFLRRQDPGQTRANLAAMIQLIKRRNIPVLLVPVPRPRLLLQDEPLYAALAKQEQVALASGVFTDVLKQKALKSDTVHPNAKGYREVAEALAGFLRDRGAV